MQAAVQPKHAAGKQLFLTSMRIVWCLASTGFTAAAAPPSALAGAALSSWALVAVASTGAKLECRLGLKPAMGTVGSIALVPGVHWQ